MNKVCAVVVTYNRKELLYRNITSLCNQTFSLDILIVDNASTDGTYEFLLNKDILVKSNISYLRLDSNTGGAGGFYAGEKKAYEKGYEYIWLMDDDGYCVSNDTLKRLMDVMLNKTNIIVNSYVTCDEKTLQPTFEIGGNKNYNDAINNGNDFLLENVGNPYNGTLVSRECFEKIGFTDPRFFIYGDEADFFERTKEGGFKWVTVLKSLYYHPINRNVIKDITIFRKNIVVLNQPVWKLYLEMRNITYNSIAHNKKKNTIYKIFFVLYMKAVINSLYSKDKKIRRLHYALLGISDGKNLNFDRQIPFKK